jgi:hypothetical protein
MEKKNKGVKKKIVIQKKKLVIQKNKRPYLDKRVR